MNNTAATQSARGRQCSLWIMLMVLTVTLGSCGRPGITRRYHNPYDAPKSFAVLVFRNLSGSENLDPVAVTDEFCGELSGIEGIQVVPVNQVLAAMADLGMHRVIDDVDIEALADRLQVDAVIVGAVTQYNPYFPPVLGMTLRLYAATVDEQDPGFENPRELAQAPTAFGMGSSRSYVPRVAISRVFDAGEDAVGKRIEAYAESRQENIGPYGWKKITTQRHYFRFVAHEMIGELMAIESSRVKSSRP